MTMTQKSKETIDACRFCWMCRHLCPVGNATGQERNTPRARALSLSLALRGAAAFEGDMIDNVYECSLCGACTQDCATGWDPVLFAKEARLAAALDGKMPAYVEKMIESFEETGNIYGVKTLEKTLAERIKTLPQKADTLLFLGADARFKSPRSAIGAIELLQKGGISFTALENEPDSGFGMDFLIGKAEETRQIMSETAKKLDFKTIIAYDSNDAKMFLREYKEWGIALEAKIVTFTSFVAGLIETGALRPQKSGKTYTVQDPAALARDLGETETLRAIVAACGENREMLLNRKETVLAGSLIMSEYMPEVMRLVAQKRWEDALHSGVQTLVTASPSEYELLKAEKPAQIELLSVEEAVLQCLSD